jgi:tRNA G18 (ribose-2'-O)-methylase SpoU
VESVNNIDNIGQLFRVAAAFGCCGALLSPDCHDPLYRKSLRVSCGCALLVPHARSTDWSADLRAVRATHGLTLIGATGSADVTLEQLAAQPIGSRVALMVGAEYAGLSAEALQACAVRARIPMATGVDSLNVAVAAAVFLSRLSPVLQR